MITRMIVSGFGGQGVMVTGQILALSAFYGGLVATALPTYGVEQRGGSANITVVLSDQEIASPVADCPDVLLAMSLPAATRYLPLVRPSGSVFLNSSQVPPDISRSDVHILRIPCDDMALELGSIKTSNIIMMGAYIGYSGLLDPVHVTSVLNKKLSKRPELGRLNAAALQAGYEIGQAARKPGDF